MGKPCAWQAILPAAERSPGLARRVARDALTTWQLTDLTDTAVLLISELVTNAVLHARTGGSGLALSIGMMGVASPAELEGLLAHELAHLRHRDVLIQTIVVILATAIIEFSRIGGFLQRYLLFVLGPVAAAFTHLLLSPKREFDADRFAAEICDSPHGLADALQRLEQAMQLLPFEASPATEPLYTTNPFAEEGLARMFVTHPPVEQRVRRLRELDPEWREKLVAA